MSTVSSTGSSTNPYVVGYSTNDLMASSNPVSASSGSNNNSSNNSANSSSGTYSQGLVSSMSGFDVNSMVNQMMTSDQIKLNKLLQTEQISQWTQDRYRSVITNMNTFSSNYFDVLSSNYALSSNNYSANTAMSSNTAAVNATATNQAKTGTYTVSCTQLATAARLTNAYAGKDSSGNAIVNSTTLSSLLNGNGSLPTTGTLSFTVNGKQVTYDLSANGSKSLSQVMSDISSQAGAAFSYSELTGKFSITDNTTGQANYLTISNTDSTNTTQNFLNNLFGTNLGGSGTSCDIGNSSNVGSLGSAGQDGSFTIKEPDGSSSTFTKSTNNFVVDGVAYGFTDLTNNATINVSPNVSSIVSKIQTFVNDYNNMIGGIQDAVNEKRDYSYSPLTSVQESQMTATQITTWNQKAQQGLLSNDGTLNNMLISMREAFYTPVSGSGLSMAAIGLSTSDDPTQGGKLTLDTKKLTAALQNNPQQVISMLTQTSTSVPTYSPDLSSSDITTRNSEEGIFQRLNDISKQYVGTQIDANGNQGILLMKAGMPNSLSETNNTLFRQLKAQSDAVTSFKTKMASDKKMYTTQFTTLQTALSQLSSQQSYLSSMLSSASSG